MFSCWLEGKGLLSYIRDENVLFFCQGANIARFNRLLLVVNDDIPLQLYPPNVVHTI